MKQIEVLFEELDSGMIKVVEIKNVAKLYEIPYEEYYKNYPSMGITRDGHLIINKSKGDSGDYGYVDNPWCSIYCNKQQFNDLIKTMKQCGENYAKAKKNAEKRKKHIIKSIKI